METLIDENRWDRVIPSWCSEAYKVLMTGDASKAIYVIGQMGIENPVHCDCECNEPGYTRERWDERAEDDWQKWLHRNHAEHNATVWRMCNAVRPGFIEELAQALRADIIGPRFFTPEWSVRMLEGFFTEYPSWLGQYCPAKRAA